MNGGRLGPARPPRGLVLATGEEVPDGESIRGRMLIVEVGAGDVNVRRLANASSLPWRGQFAEAMRALRSRRGRPTSLIGAGARPRMRKLGAGGGPVADGRLRVRGSAGWTARICCWIRPPATR